MKPLSSLAVAAAAAALAFALPAAALTTQYTTTLSGPNEASPNASPAFGDAQVTFDDVAHTVAVHVDFSGLLAAASAAHIHCCTLPTGPIAVPFTTFPNATAGTYDNTFPLSVPAFDSLLAGAAQGTAYVNIHDSVFPGGEIRGFLAPVPEPATWALLAAGLALTGAAARQRNA